MMVTGGTGLPDGAAEKWIHTATLHNPRKSKHDDATTRRIQHDDTMDTVKHEGAKSLT
jgi:hypothetical protein